MATPVILLLFFGIFDLGRAIYAYSTITNAARQAARVAIVDQDLTAIQAKAVEEAVALAIPASAVLVAYCQSGQVCEPWEPGSDTSLACTASPLLEIGCDTVVTVQYAYVPATPVIGDLVGTLTLSSTSRLAIERSYPLSGGGGTNP